MVDGRAKGEVEQPVRVLARVSPHQVEREAPDGRGRHELAHGRRKAVRAVDDGEEEAGVPGIEESSQHHGEAALLVPPPVHPHQLDQGASDLGADVGGVEELHGVAVALDSVDGLAQPLHLPALEREPLHVDHCLVAEVEVAHPGVSIVGQPLLGRRHHRHSPAVAVAVPAEGVPDVTPLAVGPDGVGGDQADPAVDGVGDQAVTVEEPLLVVA